ncbi:immunoglobulin superfamily member 5 isoform X2 [Paroedura picta]|uniref:immunoglobulin superfamily member 5 isoform X2 n=1 Tax=Paroedura picta TaxID=143630 RepID=UPI004057AABC
MDGLQRCFWMTLSLLGFLTDPGDGSFIIEGPSNLTALAGTDAHFHCMVSEGWHILIWLFKGQPILSVIYPGNAIVTDNSYSQVGYNKSTEFTSELTIHKVQLNDSGRIECSLQTTDGNEYAFLSVQVNGSLNIKGHSLTVRENETIEIVCEAVGWVPAPQITWMVNNFTVDNSSYITNQSQGSNGLYNEESILTLTPLTNTTVICLAAILLLSKPQSTTMNLVVYPPSKSDQNEDDGRIRTIILAVVLSIVGFLLLILIILLIVCCSRRRKESSYQKEMRNVSGKKNATDQNLETRHDSGNENYGYNPEEQECTKQVQRHPPFSPVDSGLEQDLEVGSASESLQGISPVPPLYRFNQHSKKPTVHQSRESPQKQSRVISSKIQKPTVHLQYRKKINPKAKQSTGQYYYTRKVSFQRKSAHQLQQSETQDHQPHAQHDRKQHKSPKIQHKKSQHPKSWPQLQHNKVDVSKGKQLHPSTKTKATRVRFLL